MPSTVFFQLQLVVDDAATMLMNWRIHVSVMRLVIPEKTAVRIMLWSVNVGHNYFQKEILLRLFVSAQMESLLIYKLNCLCKTIKYFTLMIQG